MRFIKLETTDGRVVWVDKNAIVAVAESKEKKGCSRIFLECGTYGEVKGTPDELMMRKIGT